MTEISGEQVVDLPAGSVVRGLVSGAVYWRTDHPLGAFALATLDATAGPKPVHPNARYEVLFTFPRPPKVGDKVNGRRELDSLPVLSVILDEDGDAWQKRYDGWHLAVGDAPESTVPYADVVVHIGGRDDD